MQRNTCKEVFAVVAVVRMHTILSGSMADRAPRRDAAPRRASVGWSPSGADRCVPSASTGGPTPCVAAPMRSSSRPTSERRQPTDVAGAADPAVDTVERPVRRQVDAGRCAGSPTRCGCRSATGSACTARRRPLSSPRCWGSRAGRRATTSASSRSTASSRRTRSRGSGRERLLAARARRHADRLDEVHRQPGHHATRRCWWSTSSSGSGWRGPSTGARRSSSGHASGPSTATRDRSTSSSAPRRWASSREELDQVVNAWIDRVGKRRGRRRSLARRRRGAVDLPARRATARPSA